MQGSPRIAIVGLGGVFPGATSLLSFWQNVEAGRDASRDVPADRWLLPPDVAYHPEVAKADHVYSRRACLLDPFEADLTGLAIDAETVRGLDPMFHVALASAKAAFESAQTETLDRARVGVIFGNIALPTDASSRLAVETIGRAYARVSGRMPPASSTDPLNRYVAGLPAGLVAQALGLGGGGYTLDAACASSLYAIKLAMDELVAGRADAMLAGGMARPSCLYTQMGFSQLRALSPNGTCSPFDKRANGLVVGEGGGMFLLKRLADAEREGDTIHGVLCGVGLSNDLGGSLLAPSSEGQVRAMRDAYADAGWDPHDVDLIECHATGTPVGDAAEVQSLKDLWGDEGERGRCVLGSVKSNVGHLLTGAGAAGLMKVLMALANKRLPPTANFADANPESALSDSPFTVLSKSRAWVARDEQTPRRAAISAFGFGGINAHVLVEEYRAAAASSTVVPTEPRRNEEDDVAIVGLEVAFGRWFGRRAFQERVFGGQPDKAPDEPAAPQHWWGLDDAADPRFAGYYLDGLRIPLKRFRIPPKELEEMLPQQLLMLQVMAGALEDAGVSTAEANRRAGVFVGIALDLNTTNYHVRWSLPASERDAAMAPLTANRTMGALGGIVASRLAREFRIGGPSYTISSEETSGLRAFEVAVRALRRHELDSALVGAVDLAGDPRAVLHTDQTMPFGADGSRVGEGAAAFVLKRLKDAERDGDRVYAVVRGLGAAGGRGRGDTAAYTRALERAFADAGDAGKNLGYLEIHGSGDPVETRVEQSGLARFFGTDAPATRSVKTRIGHAGAAASFASLARAVLALDQDVVPAGTNEPPRHWMRDRADGPRRLGVGAIGVDGGCGHVILEEHEPSKRVGAAPRRQPLGPRGEALFVVDGPDATAWAKTADGLHAHLEAGIGAPIESLARGWFALRAPDPEAAVATALVARDAHEALKLLNEANARVGGAPPVSRRVFHRANPLGREASVAFVFPGSGNQYAGMGRDLAAQWPDVARQQDAANDRLASQLRLDHFWRNRIDADPLACIQGQVTLGTLCSDLVRRFGVEPRAVLGYSLGQTAGYFSMGVWRDRDTMLQRLRDTALFRNELAGRCDAVRSVWNLSDDESVDWCVGVVNRLAEETRRVLETIDRAYLLIVNTPRECVIGGDRAAVSRAVETLGATMHEIPGVSTVHCDVVEPVADAYRALHLFPVTPPPDVLFYGAAGAAPLELTTENCAQSILDQALHGFDFGKQVEDAHARGVSVFIEMGPGASCTRMIGEILGDRPHLATPVCHGERDETGTLLRTLGRLIAERVPVDLLPLYGEETGAIAVPAGAEAPAIEIPIGGAPFRRPSEPMAAPALPTPAHVRATVGAGTIPGLAESEAAAAARADAHQTFLRYTQNAGAAMAANASLQLALAARLSGQGTDLAPPPATVEARPLALTREQCLEFARGSIAGVLGEEFAGIDAHPTRVRLPDEPLMLADRIVEIEAVPRSMTHGRVVTEHDVGARDWYLEADRIPTCIAVEAGQADLFLSGYLGIDFITKGLAVYRLLDAVVTFQDALPRTGAVIRYDIAIEHFFQQGDTYLFKFRFDATVDGRPLLTMREGCAGFFSEAELAAGQGIVKTRIDLEPRPGIRPEDWRPLAPPTRQDAYDDAQLDALRAGDLSCLGDAFAALPITAPRTLPGGRMRLVDRVTQLDFEGGRFSSGYIEAEHDIQPDAWFLTCHFSDDMVMPGTLMYECCLHTLRLFLLRLGWIGERDEVHYEPIAGVKSRLKCRGQVTESTKKVTYQITVKELGYDPAPFAIVDALMLADGRPVVEIGDMSVRLAGLTRDKVEALWDDTLAAGGPPLFTREQVLAFCEGNPSDCFGPAFRPFDDERFIARLPRRPFAFLDRVTAITGAKPLELAAGGVIEAEFDVAPDAWYFDSNRQARMPYAVLLEAALQPCGFFAAYLGSALTSDGALHFRNLGGVATQHRSISHDAGMLTTRVEATEISRSGGMIIERFNLAVRDKKGPVYDGTTYFGFFSPEALANQIGLGAIERHGPPDGDNGPAPMPYPSAPPFPDGTFRMIDRIDVLQDDGGSDGLGFVRGSATVDPSAWFFKAHFKNDPVWPGSLGLESFLQLLKVFAAERWGSGFEVQTPVLGQEHRWSYRGQVIPEHGRVTVEASITSIDDAARTLSANGYLIVDGRAIYSMENFGLQQMEPSATPTGQGGAT
ncbi:MAG: beta-ketoacyl synthase N-terminal-like domain-containing protein [Planctomycetota bacterium]